MIAPVNVQPPAEPAAWIYQELGLLDAGGLRWDAHAEVHAEVAKLEPNFGERGFTEVANFEELVLGFSHKVADRHDVFGFETVAGSHGKVQVGERHVEL